MIQILNVIIVRCANLGQTQLNIGDGVMGDCDCARHMLVGITRQRSSSISSSSRSSSISSIAAAANKGQISQRDIEVCCAGSLQIELPLLLASSKPRSPRQPSLAGFMIIYQKTDYLGTQIC